MLYKQKVENYCHIDYMIIISTISHKHSQLVVQNLTFLRAVIINIYLTNVKVHNFGHRASMVVYLKFVLGPNQTVLCSSSSTTISGWCSLNWTYYITWIAPDEVNVNTHAQKIHFYIQQIVEAVVRPVLSAHWGHMNDNTHKSIIQSICVQCREVPPLHFVY